MTRTVKIFVLLALLAASSCKLGDNSETAGKHKACYLPDTQRCVEATGDNPGFAEGGCAGETYEACPAEKRVGSCINNDGTKNEATIRYYDGFDANGKTDCEVSQSVYGGKYYPED